MQQGSSTAVLQFLDISLLARAAVQLEKNQSMALKELFVAETVIDCALCLRIQHLICLTLPLQLQDAHYLWHLHRWHGRLQGGRHASSHACC